MNVIELGGAGPIPFCGMLLADLGATVVRVQKPAQPTVGGTPVPHLGRGKRSISLDLGRPEAADVVLRLAAGADVLLEGFRPGVAERLGVGPETCSGRNPRLIYVRGTGWGQSGALASKAGHDINYLAASGVLHAMGPAGQPPAPPLNLVADFGGGGMLAAVGVLAALFERVTSGRGQTVDVAMVDGVGLIAVCLYELTACGLWSDERGQNLLDGSAPFYTTYETADGRYVAVGAMEPQFYARLLAMLGLRSDELPGQFEKARWPEIREAFATVFRSKTRQEWEVAADAADACLTPVLELGEVATHRYHTTRHAFVDLPLGRQPAPAPRFDRTPLPAPDGSCVDDTDGILARAGYSNEEVSTFRSLEVIS